MLITQGLGASSRSSPPDYSYFHTAGSANKIVVRETRSFERLNFAKSTATLAPNMVSATNEKLRSLQLPFPFVNVHDLIQPSGDSSLRQVVREESL